MIQTVPPARRARERGRYMPAQVLEVDLAKPMSPIRTSPRFGAVWVLARVGRRPIGWVRFPRAMVGKWITPDAFYTLAIEQVGLQWHDALRIRARERDVVPHTPSTSVVVCTREHPDLLERQLK